MCLTSLNLAAQVLVEDSMFFDGEMRDWVMFEPIGYDGSTAAPLVMNLHGAGSTATEQIIYSQFNAVADTVGALVIYPNALENFWNSGFASLPPGYVDDVYFLTSLIDSIKQWYNIDAERVYTMGMSNGGFMSYRLVCETTDVFAAMASVTGSMTGSVFSDCDAGASAGEAVPVLQMHGTNDGTVPFTGGPDITSQEDVISYWTSRNSCPSPAVSAVADINMSDGSTVEISQYYLCNDYSEVIFYKIDNGGHTWPGTFPVSTLGNTNQDIQAEFEIWKFFSRHKRSDQFTSIEEATVNLDQLTVSPNPFHDKIRIELPTELASSLASADYQLRITDLSGKLLYSKSLEAQAFATGSFNMGNLQLESGVYLLHMFVEGEGAQNSAAAVVKLIKE